MEGQDYSLFAFLTQYAPRATLWDPWAVLTLPPSLCLQGIINLGTSENKLCFDLLSRRVSPSGISSSQGLSFLGFPWNTSLIRACCLPQQPWPEPGDPGSKSVSGTTSVILGESLPYLDPASSPLPHTQSLRLLAGSCSHEVGVG